jgi:hypothetical protein
MGDVESGCALALAGAQSLSAFENCGEHVRVTVSVYDRDDPEWLFVRCIYFLFEGKAIPTESCRQRSFQILACYLSNRTDPHASIVLVDCTVDRQIGFSQVVI